MDIGTSSTRTALFDGRGRRLHPTLAHHPYTLCYRADGGAELSAPALEQAVRKCLSSTLRKYHQSRTLRKVPIAAVGGSAFWHGMLGLDRHLRPVTPVFTWADSRAEKDAARLRAKFSEKKIHARTGCMLRSTFWPAKLSWLRRSQPKLFGRVSRWVSPSDWLYYRLFGVLGSSASMASATGLYNLETRTWDEQLLDICRVDSVALPNIVNRFGPVKSGPFHYQTVFPPIGDGAAGNLGSGADAGGAVAVNIGTSAAVRIVQKNREAICTEIPPGLFRYIVDQDRVVTGGAVSNAGNLREWCLRELRLENKSAALERALSRKAAAVDSLTVLPFWVSERAPTWPEHQWGIIDNLQQSTTAPEILRAVTTSVFYRLGQILRILEQATGRSRRVIVSGGGVHSLSAVRMLADALGRDLNLSSEPEASLCGAAVHALNQLGIERKKTAPGRLVRFDRRLAGKHRKRRDRQIALETLLTEGAAASRRPRAG